MWLGGRANSQPVLPAFILGLVMSSHYAGHREEQVRLRVVAFAFLTRFFFLKGGMSVSAGALWANLGILAILFVGKMVPKFAGVYPLARRFTAPHALMPFERILVAIDGSEASDHAFGKALELAEVTGARLTALAIEGPLPAYAATIGEVDEVKREKDMFFGALAERARHHQPRRSNET